MHSAPHARAAAKRNSSPVPSIKANYCSSLRRADHSAFDLLLRLSRLPQIAARTSKAAMPHQGLAWTFLDKHVANPSAYRRRSCPLCFLTLNATPGAPYAAAVRPQPCLASCEPVLAGVTCCGTPVMDASMRVSPGSAVCGAQKERGTLLRCAVGPCLDVLPLAFD